MKSLVRRTYQAVFWFNWTTVNQVPRTQVDLHYVSTGSATESELIVL